MYCIGASFGRVRLYDERGGRKSTRPGGAAEAGTKSPQMGFLSRLFGRVQEAPVAPTQAPAREPALAAPPEPVAEPVPVEESEPVVEEEPAAAAGETRAEVEPQPEPEPESEPPAAVVAPEPEQASPAGELVLTLDEAIAALREAGSDGIRVGFLARDYARAAEDDRRATRRRLVRVLEEELRSRGLLAPEGRFELREQPELADARRS